MVGVEDLARASTTSSDSSERLPHGISNTVSSHVRIHPCSGLCSLVRSSLSTSRSIAVAHVVGQHQLGELGAVLGDDVVGVAALAQLLADRVHLLTQQELALRLVHALGDAVADLLRHLELGQRLAHPGQRLLEARLGVERLEQLDLALDRQVGRPARGVGQRAGVVDAGEGVGDARVAELLGDAAHDGAVLAHHLAGPPGHRGRLGDGLGLDPHAGLVARRRCGPTTARDRPRSTRARCPPGSSPSFSMRATVPTRV